MTDRPEMPPGASHLGPLHRPQAGAGRFMITLCALAAPVAIRPPQSPHLRAFRFFTGPVRQTDGSERLHLHMGYFDTLGDAERCAESVRRQHPSAFATLAPEAAPRPVDSKTPPSLHDVADAMSRPGADHAAAKDESLTDTQVLKILEARRNPQMHDELGDQGVEQIELLRADDTGTREILREAVVRGAPVSFAVQLRWSVEPIDLNRVRMLAAFKPYTLYATETRRHGHCRHFLRLGFFGDPISAKQVAVQVRFEYETAAVVPVVEPEITRARAAGKGTAGIAYLEVHDVDQGGHPGDAPGSAWQPEPVKESPRRSAVRVDTARQRLEPRAITALWEEADPLSASGVRHLRIEVQEHMSGRWKKINLSERRDVS